MTDINKVIVIGRLTQDAKVDFIASGTAKSEVSIAVNRSVKKGGNRVVEVSFFNVTIWGKTAENLQKFLTKGTQICVEGFLRQDRWEKDGQKQSRVSIIAESVQLLGGGKNQQGGQSNGNEEFPEDNPFGN